MINKIKNNLSLKIISLIISFIIWMSVINIINPIVNEFVNVPIEILNEESVHKLNKTYVINGPKICRISYKVSAEEASLVRQSDFKAYVDLNDLISTNQLPIHFETLNNVDKYARNISLINKTLHVELKDITRSDIEVKYNIIGDLDDGRSVGDVFLSPNFVYVSGSGEDINDISHISIDIPIKKDEEMFSGVATAHIVTNDGRTIDGKQIELSANQINYTVTIFSRANVTLNVKVDGSVKNGYNYAGASVEPNMILIEGPKSAIENIYSIDLPLININELSQDEEYYFLVSDILPAGLKCSSVNEIKVKIMVNNNVINMPSVGEEGPHLESNIIYDIVEE